MANDLSSALMESMMQYARPQDVPQIRRSQYLTEALQSLRETGAQQSRTPLALGANLLAEAFYQRGSDRAFKSAYGGLRGGMQDYAKVLGAGLPGADQSAAPPGALADALGAPPMAGGMGAAPPSGPGPSPPPMAAPGPAAPVPGPAPAPAPGPAPGPGPEAAPAGPPTQAVSPQEVALAKQWLSSGIPALQQQGLALLAKLKQTSVSPVSLPPGFGYGPDGQARDYAHHTTYTDGQKPGTEIGVDETGKKSVFDTGVAGAAPPGTVFQGGAYNTVPIRVGGRTMDQGYSPEQLGSKQKQVLDSDEYKTATEAMKAYKAMTGVFSQTGGIPGYAMLDTFARAINPGAVARAGTIQAIKESRGLPDTVKGMLLNLRGGGELTPAIKQQILDATLPFVQASYGAAMKLNHENVAWAGRHGVDPADVTADLGEPPAPAGAPTPAGAPDAGVARSNAPASAPPGAAAPMTRAPPPRVGEIVKGRAYLGGNPASPMSWGPRVR